MEKVVHASSTMAPCLLSGMAKGLASFPDGSDYLSIYGTVAIQDISSRVAKSPGEGLRPAASSRLQEVPPRGLLAEERAAGPRLAACSSRPGAAPRAAAAPEPAGGRSGAGARLGEAGAEGRGAGAAAPPRLCGALLPSSGQSQRGGPAMPPAAAAATPGQRSPFDARARGQPATAQPSHSGERADGGRRPRGEPSPGRAGTLADGLLCCGWWTWTAWMGSTA